MKKIIELAEKYFESVKNNESIFSQVKRKKELHAAIKEYRTLQAAPITEEWLKEHGWVVFYYINDFNHASKRFGNNIVRWHNGYYMEIFRVDADTDADVLIDNIETVAQLLDALELCGITMKD